MKIKIILLFILIGNNTFSQIDSIKYLRQTPPGDTPKVFAPGIICSSNVYEQYTLWSPDGMEFYYQHTTADWESAETFYCYYDSSEWIGPVKIGFGNPALQKVPDIFENIEWAMMPFLSSDGNFAYVMNDGNVWMSEKSDTGWTEPQSLNLPIEPGTETWWLSVTDDQTVYITLGHEAQSQYDIYRAKKVNGTYPQLENMSLMIGTYQDFFHFIAPDESYIIISMYNASGGLGGYDLYISYKGTEKYWTKPKNLGSLINSSMFDMAAYVTPDQKYIFFTRRGNSASTSDIYWVDAGIIDSLKNSNFAPYLINNIADLTDTLGKTISFTLPDSIFFDYNGNETLTFDAELSNGEDLSGWLEFNEITKTFSGSLTEAGSFDIKVTATDTAGASASDVFNLKIEESTGIYNSSAKIDNISVHPNPVKNTLYIEYPELSNKKLSYKILDIAGKTYLEGLLTGNVIDISKLNKGVYILKIKFGEYVNNEKIIVE